MGRLQEAAKPKERTATSRVHEVLAHLDEDDREDLKQMLADENITASTIERVLRRECGVTLSHTTVTRYREMQSHG